MGLLGNHEERIDNDDDKLVTMILELLLPR